MTTHTSSRSRPARMAALIRYFLVRAVADRLIAAWPFLLVAIAMLALAIGQGMMLEKAEASLTFLAAASRLALVLVTVSHTAIWISRDFESKEIELLASKAAGRLDLLLAMLACVVILAFAMVVLIPLAALPFAVAGTGGLVLWTVTLALEAALAGTLTLFIALAIPNPVIAILAAVGWYVLARLSGTLLGTAGIPGEGQEALMAPASGVDAGIWLDRGMHLVSLLLPRLDLMAQGDWLVHAPAITGMLALTVLQCIVHAGLIATAAFLDFRRRAF